MFHRITEKRNRKNIEKIATNLLACSEDAGYWMFPGKKFNVIKMELIILNTDIN